MGNDINWLTQRIKGNGRPVLIDGGMGTELEKSGVPMDGKVWSGRAVLSNPDSVRQVHEVFINAGAEVIIANTFATARHMLEPGGLGDHVRGININAVKLAREAIENAAEKPIAVAGSICEWSFQEEPKWRSAASIRESSAEQATLLFEAGVDLIAMEMCQSATHSAAATEAALETGLPVWAGVSARQHKGCGHLSTFDVSGDSFEPVVQALADYPVEMINIMHTPVPDVDAAMAIVRKHWGGPIGVYPESGYFKMPNWNFVDIIEPDELVTHAKKWVSNGATLTGGCCGLGPEHIKELRDGLTR